MTSIIIVQGIGHILQIICNGRFYIYEDCELLKEFHVEINKTILNDQKDEEEKLKKELEVAVVKMMSKKLENGADKENKCPAKDSPAAIKVRISNIFKMKDKMKLYIAKHKKF